MDANEELEDPTGSGSFGRLAFFDRGLSYPVFAMTYGYDTPGSIYQ